MFLEDPLIPVHPIVEALVHRLQPQLRKAFEERAGIFQFEVGRERELSEALALLEVIRMDPLAVSGLVLLQGALEGKPVVVLAADAAAAQARLDTLGATGVVFGDLPMALSSLGGAARLTALPEPTGKARKSAYL